MKICYSTGRQNAFFLTIEDGFLYILLFLCYFVFQRFVVYLQNVIDAHTIALLKASGTQLYASCPQSRRFLRKRIS